MANNNDNFRKALCAVTEEENSDIPENLNYSFSKRFERRMNKLIRAEKRWSWHLVNTRGRNQSTASFTV